eukprot:7029814-Prymnesium_polylepis.2
MPSSSSAMSIHSGIGSMRSAASDLSRSRKTSNEGSPVVRGATGCMWRSAASPMRSQSSSTLPGVCADVHTNFSRAKASVISCPTGYGSSLPAADSAPSFSFSFASGSRPPA